MSEMVVGKIADDGEVVDKRDELLVDLNKRVKNLERIIIALEHCIVANRLSLELLERDIKDE